MTQPESIESNAPVDESYEVNIKQEHIKEEFENIDNDSVAESENVENSSTLSPGQNSISRKRPSAESKRRPSVAKKPKQDRKVLEDIGRAALPSRTSVRLQQKALKQLKEPEEEDESTIIGQVDDETENSTKENREPPRTNPLRKPNGGLTNLGNTCFMNAVLQGLFGLPIFVASLKTFLVKLKSSNITANKDSLLHAVDHLISSTECDARDEATTKLREIIIKKHEEFDNYDMHDAHEFLQIFINIISTECAEKITEDVDKKLGLHCPIKENFELSFKHTRTCSNCKFDSVMVENDLNISLQVPDGPSSVQSCVSQHFLNQQIEKTCDSCKQYMPHTEITRVNKLPRIVVVHFQRLTPSCDPETGDFQYGKKQVPIELSNSISFKYVSESHVNSQKCVLDDSDLKPALESLEHMKQWESKQPLNVESGITIEDNKKLMKLGPRSIQQLTEEQQFKLAISRSLIDDESDEECFDYDEIDSQCAYLTKDESQLLGMNSKSSLSEAPLLTESYSLLASVNHHGSRADTGHYTADVFNPGSKRWTSFNDNRVRTIREKNSKGPNKIMLPAILHAKRDITATNARHWVDTHTHTHNYPVTYQLTSPSTYIFTTINSQPIITRLKLLIQFITGVNDLLKKSKVFLFNKFKPFDELSFKLVADLTR